MRLVVIAMTPAVVAITTTAIVVRDAVLHALLEPLNAVLKVAGLAWVEPAASGTMQPVFDAVSFVAKPVGAAIADAVAAIEPVDLPLDIVDPRLERAHLAPIAAEAIVVAVVAVVVAIRRGLRLRIILRGSGA